MRGRVLAPHGRNIELCFLQESRLLGTVENALGIRVRSLYRC